MEKLENPGDTCDSVGNMMWINPFKSSTPGVPINKQSILDLKNHFFASPIAKYPGVVKVSVTLPLTLSAMQGYLTMISPEEKFHALILRIADDVRSERPTLDTW